MGFRISVRVHQTQGMESISTRLGRAGWREGRDTEREDRGKEGREKGRKEKRKKILQNCEKLKKPQIGF